MPAENTPQASDGTKVHKSIAALLAHPLVLVVIVILVMVIGGYGLYKTGYNNGKQNTVASNNGKQNGSQVNDSYFNLPASAEVVEVSDKKIEIKTAQGETKTIAIEARTQISKKSGSAKVADIKPGKRVVVFTRDEAGTAIATRIIVQ